MAFNVHITDFAYDQLDQILDYITNRLLNPEAAANVLEDVDIALEKLETSASAVKLCDEPELAQHGYSKYLLEKHRYILLYRIEGRDVFIDRIYHELQDYLNLES